MQQFILINLATVFPFLPWNWKSFTVIQFWLVITLENMPDLHLQKFKQYPSFQQNLFN